jgi:surface antigen
MLVTCGLVAAFGLPAYATTFTPPATDAASADTPVGVQSVAVEADAVASDVARDSFTATTVEELAQKKATALRAQASRFQTAQNASVAGTFVQSGDNDYPWPNAATGGAFSPLRYVYRQCVDFVAWRLNRDAGSTQAPFKYDWSYLTPGGGDGRQWLPAWQKHGWTVSDVPVAGAVAYTGGNHIAYVKEARADGTVVIEEYNWVPNSYSQRVLPASSIAAFLYPPPR